jgi:hypothetical protein
MCKSTKFPSLVSSWTSEIPVLPTSWATSKVLPLKSGFLGQHAPEEQQGGPASTYSGLKASIRAQRGLFMPVIVTPRPDGDYTVIEGNTRVAIFRELADEGAPGNWDSIPAIVQSNLPEAGVPPAVSGTPG